MKTHELIFFPAADELAHAVAGAWLDEVVASSRAGKPHSVALSGGRVTQKFFAASAEFSRSRGVSLAGVDFFWADERCVPPTDAESNFKLADELLFQPLGLAADKIHRIHGELAPAEATRLATADLARVASALDLIFLGMGEDGHVASLFPNAPAEILNCREPFLFVTDSPKPPPNRVSLSYAAIAAAKQVWVLASGQGKAAAFAESLSPTGKTPLARVLQNRAQTKIFTDIC